MQVITGSKILIAAFAAFIIFAVSVLLIVDIPLRAPEEAETPDLSAIPFVGDVTLPADALDGEILPPETPLSEVPGDYVLTRVGPCAGRDSRAARNRRTGDRGRFYPARRHFDTKPPRTISFEEFMEQVSGNDEVDSAIADGGFPEGLAGRLPGWAKVYCTREHTVRDQSGKIVGLETEGPYGEFSRMTIGESKP